MSTLELDPLKLYAELRPWTNIVVRVFAGTSIPMKACPSWRKFIEIPAGTEVAIGDSYSGGKFRKPLRQLGVLEGSASNRLQRNIDKLAKSDPVKALLIKEGYDYE